MRKTKEQNSKIKISNTNKGITLLALVITIVVMLILISVTVTVAINGGLFEYAGKSKYETEISREKEIIETASILAEGSSKTGRITVEEMQKALNKVADTEGIIAIDNTDTIAIKFGDSNRCYLLNNSGNLEGPIEMAQVDNAGNMGMGTNQTYANTTEFVINCIEDLVAFSIMTNGGNADLGLEKGDFANKNVKLARDLDFNSIFSYNDYSTKIYGDLNGDETTDELRTELTKQGDKCGGFTPIASFKGTFDGQGNKICNLYENRGTSSAGLFASSSGTIQNLGLENITLTGGSYIGGIVAIFSGELTNCFVEGKSTITGSGNIGLIAGNCGTVKECYSKGTLKAELTSGNFGGIAGYTWGGTIKKCYNIMEINISNVTAGGILGKGQTGTIEECFHIGDINGYGILGLAVLNFEVVVKNCYCVAENSLRLTFGNTADLFNCYCVSGVTLSSSNLVKENYGGHIVHCFAKRCNGNFNRRRINRK